MVNQTLLKAFGGGPSIEGLLYQLADSRGGRWENIVEGDGEGGQRNVRNYNFNGQDYWGLQREAQDLAAQRALPADILALGKMAGGEWGNVAPVNYGPGNEALRDAQGRILGSYQVTEGNGESGARYLPWDILQKYPQLGGQLATQYQEASSNPLKDPMFLAMIAAGAGAGFLGGSGAISAEAAAAAAEAADAAAIIGGSGAGGGGALAGGAAAGGTAAANTLMPAAIPPVDPTFGNALIQSAPGVWAAPGAAGYVGAPLGLNGTQVIGADLPPSVSGGGGGSGGSGPQMPAPPAPPGSTSVFGEILNKAKELSPYAPLLGMAAGGLAGAASGTGSAGTITVEEGIPDWLMPYVKPTLNKYSTDVQNYQIDPYGVMPSAMQEFKNTVSGMYLDPSTNKWLEEYYKLGAERIKGTLSPSFGHMQAFGSHSGYNEALSRGLGDFATNLYGGNYAKERDRQTQMTAAAPNFLTQSSTSAFAPYQQYLSTIGNLGKKKDQPYFEPSAMQNILGGAMMGYGLGNIFK
jgi:hypothetical protein